MTDFVDLPEAEQADLFSVYVGVDLAVGPYPVEQRDALLLALRSAKIMVADVLEDAYREVPKQIQERLIKEVGHALFKRADSPTGSSQYADFGTGQPVMGPRDPLQQVWPIIRRYVLPL